MIFFGVRKIFSYALTTSLVIVLGFFLIRTVGGATDADGDGYNSVASGGNDCFDQKYADFKDISGDTTCDSTRDPAAVNLSLDIADHSWIKDDSGTWHIFFSAGTPTEIYHYTTTNFSSYSEVGKALATTTDKFDFYGLWAPHVIKSGSTYYMFYTGVTGAGGSASHDERIGLATSSDLTTWNRVTDPGVCTTLAGDGCILECSADWTLWGDQGSYTEACRDPFVIWDADNSRWVMFMTTKYTNLREIISAAYSTDLTSWTMTGYLAVTTKDLTGRLGQLSGNVAENAFVTEYNDLYYLWFNDSSDTEDNIDSVPTSPRTMQQYVTSTSLVVDASGSSNWHYEGYTPLPGVNATEVIKTADDVWVMSQSITNGNVGAEYWSDPSYRSLILHRVVWNDDGTFGKSRLTDLSCRVSSSSIHPGATEICGDGIDEDCDGVVDQAAICSPATSVARVGGGGPPPAPAIGAGSSTNTIGIGEQIDLGEITESGVNVLLYINSRANFSLSQNNSSEQYNLKVTGLDLNQKKVVVNWQSDLISTDFNLGESKKIDLNNDGQSDLDLTFADLIINRIELTLKKISSLQTEVVRPTPVESAVPGPNKPAEIYSFKRDLKRGQSGSDVYELQKFLNQQGFIVALAGAGSPGQETRYFGSATRAALAKFQKVNKIKPAAGYFGAITRKFIAAL
ncbi:MAG: hypothetical protein C3F02_03160 [Parcubacteria group bacterium]|nr:MAG: hypothetical protein C3F02_03160 [Parcubacteria group bacterium]